MSEYFNNKQAVLRDIALLLPPEFELIEFLGEGGHGIVLKAIHKTMQQTVALKIIKEDNSDDMQKRIQRMQNEAKVLAKLNHKNIVRVYQMGACKDGTPFLICEFLEGITLEQFLKNQSTISPKLILEIFTQMLDALACAHDNGLLHRDVKPSNVIIMKDAETGDLSVKLVDFGIARSFESADAQPLGLTRTIQISGSAPYMSPEQCKGERIDHRSDLYSVGCILFQCLSGKPPFHGETPVHTRYMQIHDEAKIPNSDEYALTASRLTVYKTALRALSKDRNDRPQNAEEFKRLLIEALPTASKRTSWTTIKRGAFQKYLVPLLALLTVISLALVISLVSNKKTPETIPTAKKASPLKLLSKAAKLKHLINDWGSTKYQLDTKTMMKALTQIEKLNTFIDSLGPHDNILRYAALRERAVIEYEFKFDPEAKNSWESLLKLCTAQGRQTMEATECYYYLARIAELNKDLASTKDLLRKAEILLQSNENNNAPVLDLPAIVDNRDTDPHNIYAFLGEVAEHEQNLKKAVDYYARADEEQIKRSGVAISTPQNLKQIDLLIQIDPAKARMVIAERYEALLVPMNYARQDRERVVALITLASRAKKANDLTMMDKCIKAASDILKTLSQPDPDLEKDLEIVRN